MHIATVVWSGTRRATSNDTFGLFFSGHNNIEATIDYLSVNAGLNTSNNFVIFSEVVPVVLEPSQLRIRGESVTVGNGCWCPGWRFSTSIELVYRQKPNVPEEDVRDSNFPYLTKHSTPTCRQSVVKMLKVARQTTGNVSSQDWHIHTMRYLCLSWKQSQTLSSWEDLREWTIKFQKHF